MTMPAMHQGSDPTLHEAVSHLDLVSSVSTATTTPPRAISSGTTPRALTPGSSAADRRRSLQQTPRKYPLKKTNSAPELPPIQTNGSTSSRPGSARSRTSQARPASLRPSSSHGSISGSQDSRSLRCASLPSVHDGSHRDASGRRNTSYSFTPRRRVSVVVEDPYNEVTSPVLELAKQPQENTAATPLQEVLNTHRSTTAPVQDGSHKHTKPVFMLLDPEEKPLDPYSDPDWKQYSEKARLQKRSKTTDSINTYSLYHLDPYNINKTVQKDSGETQKPKSAPKPKSPQVQTISTEQIENMVNPVDTDFRIMKWIRECEEAQQGGMWLPHLHDNAHSTSTQDTGYS